MIRSFLRYAAGEASVDENAAMDIETVGGINTGLSALAFVAAVIVSRYAELEAVITWVMAFGASVLQFFLYRLILTSVHSKRGKGAGPLTIGALLRLMPEIFAIVLTSWVISASLFIGFLGKDVEAQAALMQSASNQASPATPGARPESKPLRVGLSERYVIAQQVSPATGTLITVLVLLAAMLPVVVGRRSPPG